MQGPMARVDVMSAPSGLNMTTLDRSGRVVSVELRQAMALERIATALEAIAASCTREKETDRGE